ncbi:hypothetical protein EIN_296860 [Entamoeba invadens IP1]|uniref:Uncharacterized protein n=1 Tax=Entamoeba invadens IP1 TaxID=370355 RepID=L7FMI8_ENTIV|nr:hypothetical protein EIN_296860 [Entamoeba invadens IP1]ELP86366.1 hypothetical protein EIN_296860 [Entamoeba invadens IP1]|eukprot:XP_004185712.1 hypothetical protein EIN_296860 [Entamoeba invadens IP1]
MMRNLIILCFLFVLVCSQNTNTEQEPEQKGRTLCFTEFIAVNMDAENVKQNNVFNCYDRIDKYQYDIKGFNIQSVCYISTKNSIVNKTSNRLGRCGEWLELVGPSEQKVDCMVAGSIDFELPDTPDMADRIVGLSYSLFKRLTTYSDETQNSVQVTLSEVAFDIGIPPTLYVISRTETEAVIQFTDSNKLGERVGIEKNGNVLVYYKQDDDTYTVPLFKEALNIQLIAYDDEKIRFLSVNLNTINKTTATIRFNADKSEPCTFTAETQIVGNDLGDVRFKKWSVWQINPDYSWKLFPPGAASVEMNMYGLSLIGVEYPAPMRVQKHFLELKMVLDVEDADQIHATQTLLLLDTKLAVFDIKSIKLIKDNLVYKKTKKSNTEIEIGVSLASTSLEFTNVIGVVLNFSNPQKVVLKKAYLKRITSLKNGEDCDLRTFDCLNTECSITNTSIDEGAIPFKTGCIPYCGSCRDGNVCTTKGKCIKEKNNNLRSSSQHNFLLLVFVLLWALI